MDGEPEPGKTDVRPYRRRPGRPCPQLNRQGVAYVIAGRLAITRLGFVRATEDTDRSP